MKETVKLSELKEKSDVSLSSLETTLDNMEKNIEGTDSFDDLQKEVKKSVNPEQVSQAMTSGDDSASSFIDDLTKEVMAAAEDNEIKINPIGKTIHKLSQSLASFQATVNSLKYSPLEGLAKLDSSGKISLLSKFAPLAKKHGIDINYQLSGVTGAVIDMAKGVVFGISPETTKALVKQGISDLDLWMIKDSLQATNYIKKQNVLKINDMIMGKLKNAFTEKKEITVKQPSYNFLKGKMEFNEKKETVHEIKWPLVFKILGIIVGVGATIAVCEKLIRSVKGKRVAKLKEDIDFDYISDNILNEGTVASLVKRVITAPYRMFKNLIIKLLQKVKGIVHALRVGLNKVTDFALGVGLIKFAPMIAGAIVILFTVGVQYIRFI